MQCIRRSLLGAYAVLWFGVAAAQESASFEGAVDSALATHPSIRQAGFTISAARVGVESATWLRYPSVSSDYTTGEGSTSRTLRITQPVFDFGRASNAKAAAQARVIDSQAALTQAKQDLAARVGDAYVGVAQTESRIALLRRYESELTRLAGIIERRAAQDVAPLADVQVAQARLKQAQAQGAAATAQLEVASASLAALVGRPIRPIGLPRPHIDWKSADTASIVDRHPSVMIARAQVRTIEREADLDRSQLLPTIAVQYERTSPTTPGYPASRTQLVMKYTLDGGIGSWTALRAKADQAEAARQRTHTARIEVQQQISALRAELSQYPAQRQSAVAALEATRSMNGSMIRQFETGRKSWLDVLNSQRELLDAESTLLSIEAGEAQAAVRWSVVTRALEQLKADEPAFDDPDPVSPVTNEPETRLP